MPSYKLTALVDPLPWLRALGPRGVKWLLLALVAGILAGFGDLVLPWLGHLAFLLLETVEVSLERLLEHVFSLTPRGAQVVIAWSALGLLIAGLVWAVRRACRKFQELRLDYQQAMQQLKTDGWKTVFDHPSVKLILTLLVLTAVALLFS